MRSPGRVGMAAAAIVAAAAVLAPERAAAHAAERAFVLMLPTDYYLAGGALAVVASFIVLALAPGAPARLRARLSLRIAWPRHAGIVRWLAFASFAGLIAAGVWGPTDPLANPLPIVLWTLWWVGYTGLTALVGDSWGLVNPWSAPVGLARRLGVRPIGRLPARIGYWPALAGLFAFVWLEIVSLAPMDPRGLAHAATLYWMIHLFAMLAFGERRWRARGETFSVFFRLIGRVAPLHFRPGGVTLTTPGARLAHGPLLAFSGWLFVTSVIASISFDGLAATFFWLDLLGLNPLAFPGRSAVVLPNSIGLAGAWAAMALAYAGAVALGARMAGSRAGLSSTLGRIGLSLVPIALAYHMAHYLTVLMLDAQYARAILAEALGLGHVHVTASFLNNIGSVTAIWQVQTALIVGGHVLAVLVAHAAALDLECTPRHAALSQVPLALLMVGLTLLGLWLLAAPTGA